MMVIMIIIIIIIIIIRVLLIFKFCDVFQGVCVVLLCGLEAGLVVWCVELLSDQHAPPRKHSNQRVDQHV